MTSDQPRQELHAVSTEDRRAQERRRVLRGATISFNRGYGAFACRVRDETQNGARLVFGETMAVPNVFTIEIAGDGVRRTGHVHWRTPTELGISLD